MPLRSKISTKKFGVDAQGNGVVIYPETDTQAVKSTTLTNPDGSKKSLQQMIDEGLIAGGDSNVQADWNETNSSSDAYIKNKPSVYTKTEVDAKIDAIQTGMSDEEREQLEANTEDIAEAKTNIATNNALIKSLQQSGLPQGEDYSFAFLEEAAMEGLTADNTVGMMLYFGLEEDESNAATYDATTGIITADGSYDATTGIVTVNGSYDSTTGIITL